MSEIPDPPVEPGARPPSAGSSVARLLYTQNPFYVVSALLVLLATRAMFDRADGAWPRLALLGGYLAALVTTAALVVRRARLWDDARSILIAVLLVALATSAMFDDVLLGSPASGTLLHAVGLAIAALAVEGALRGARVRTGLPARLSLHLLLVVLFVAPPVVARWARALGTADADALAVPIGGFPIAAAIALAPLLVAAWRGPRAVDPDGAPWGWPWLPWLPFAFASGAAAARTYWLTLAFFPGPGLSTPFGAWLLAPLVLAWAPLLIEAGRSSRSRATIAVGLALPALAVAMAATSLGAAGLERWLVLAWTQRIGSPPLLLLHGATLVYGYAWLRGIAIAEPLLAAGLIALAGIPSGPWRWTPLAVLAAIQMTAAFVRPGAARWLRASLALIAAAAARVHLAAPPLVTSSVLAHAALLATLWVGLRHSSDPRGRRLLAAALVGTTALFYAGLLLPGWVPVGPSARPPRVIYLVAVAALAPLGWALTRGIACARAMLATAPIGFLAAADTAHTIALSGEGAGPALLFWGAATFAAGAAISAAKAGVGASGAAALAREAGLHDLRARAPAWVLGGAAAAAIAFIAP